jgi:hypothetical protein
LRCFYLFSVNYYSSTPVGRFISSLLKFLRIFCPRIGWCFSMFRLLLCVCRLIDLFKKFTSLFRVTPCSYRRSRTAGTGTPPSTPWLLFLILCFLSSNLTDRCYRYLRIFTTEIHRVSRSCCTKIFLLRATPRNSKLTAGQHSTPWLRIFIRSLLVFHLHRYR